jgi:hypothetical protein
VTFPTTMLVVLMALCTVRGEWPALCHMCDSAPLGPYASPRVAEYVLRQWTAIKEPLVLKYHGQFVRVQLRVAWQRIYDAHLFLFAPEVDYSGLFSTDRAPVDERVERDTPPAPGTAILSSLEDDLSYLALKPSARQTEAIERIAQRDAAYRADQKPVHTVLHHDPKCTVHKNQTFARITGICSPAVSCAPLLELPQVSSSESRRNSRASVYSCACNVGCLWILPGWQAEQLGTGGRNRNLLE